MAYQAGDVVVVNFPGAVSIKRRPAVVLSSEEYHALRPDIVVGLITSQEIPASGATDYSLRDWRAAGLQRASTFRSFFATLPRSTKLKVIGHLSSRDWRAVQTCVGKALVFRPGPEAVPSGGDAPGIASPDV